MASWFDTQLSELESSNSPPAAQTQTPLSTKITRAISLDHHEYRNVFVRVTNDTFLEFTFDFCGTRLGPDAAKSIQPLQIKQLLVRANETVKRHICDVRCGDVVTTQSVEATATLHQGCHVVLTKADLLERKFSQMVANRAAIVEVRITYANSVSHPGNWFPMIKFRWINDRLSNEM